MTLYLMKLTFKRKNNCNSLVTRLGQVILTLCQWLRNLNIDPNINLNSSFSFNQTSNQTIISTLLFSSSSLLHQLGYHLLSYLLKYNLLYISTRSSQKKSPTCLIEPKLSSWLNGWLAKKNYLQISAFFI